MSQTETVKTELEARFPFLAGAIRVQRERRLWIEVAQDRFLEVFEHLVKGSQFSNLCTITGLDLGAELGFIRTVTHLFEGAAIYERELEDLLGAKVEGLPSGPRYPLPDDWPTDEHPLLKDWKAKGEAAEAAAPASPAAATPATPAAADAQEGAPRE